MSVRIPAELKSADLLRFATRASQLEKYKPIASYWLEYYVLQHILTRSLHTSSVEVAEYAAQLMDKVEATKQEYQDEPAITDDITAQAYMEHFATETLSRAEKAHFEDTVTKQTVDTLQAATVFFETLAIWGELSPEVKAKVKFAKYHALRIVKALKNGEDPNASNPKPEPEPVQTSTDMDVEDELRKLEQEARPMQASVVDEAMEDSISLPPAPTTIAKASQLDQTPAPTTGYFPSTSPPAVQQPPAITPAVLQPPVIPPTPVKPATIFSPPPPPPPVSASGLRTDDDAVIAAQKHAKWAISALNFEDVPTAVRELKLALQSLGGL